MTKSEIKELQHLLNASGYGPLDPDGVYGEDTAKAYRVFIQNSNAGAEGVEMPVPPPAKPWWMSKAVLASIAGVIAGVAGVFGWSIDSGQTTELLTASSAAILAATSFWGSVRRKATIDPTLVAPNVRIIDGRLRKVSNMSANPPEPTRGNGGFPAGPFFDFD